MTLPDIIEADFVHMITVNTAKTGCLHFFIPYNGRWSSLKGAAAAHEIMNSFNSRGLEMTYMETVSWLESRLKGNAPDKHFRIEFKEGGADYQAKNCGGGFIGTELPNVIVIQHRELNL